MIWDHHVVHIIMLTREVEGGKRKAHTYWPNGGDDGRQIVFGQFAVTLVGEQMNERQDICTRRLLVKNIAVRQLVALPSAALHLLILCFPLCR
jgi:protein tyrosine phosphatase